MPVRPENRARYPANWAEISRATKERAGWRCECTGECGRHAGRRCVEAHGQAARFARGRVILTVAHLDHRPENCDRENLRAYCQGCHLRYDSAEHAATRRRTRHAAQVSLFEDEPQPRPHRCHAHGCDVAVHPRLLMCRRHWALVPMALQREVWRHYRKGQERDERPSAEYLAAARAAIDAVASAQEEEMRAITLWQPWAYAITHRGKRIENRTWRPTARIVGKRIAIHAGTRVDQGAASFLGVACEDLVRGAVVATARLARVVEELDAELRGQGQAEWWAGPVGWVLEDVRVLERPVPVRGYQGLWTLPLDVRRAVEPGGEV